MEPQTDIPLSMPIVTDTTDVALVDPAGRREDLGLRLFLNRNDVPRGHGVVVRKAKDTNSLAALARVAAKHLLQEEACATVDPSKTIFYLADGTRMPDINLFEANDVVYVAFGGEPFGEPLPEARVDAHLEEPMVAVVEEFAFLKVGEIDTVKQHFTCQVFLRIRFEAPEGRKSELTKEQVRWYATQIEVYNFAEPTPEPSAKFFPDVDHKTDGKVLVLGGEDNFAIQGRVRFPLCSHARRRDRAATTTASRRSLVSFPSLPAGPGQVLRVDGAR